MPTKTIPEISTAPETSSNPAPASPNMDLNAVTPNTPTPLLSPTAKPESSPLPPPNTSQTSPTILATFTLYPNLPLEIRFKIIHHAIPLFPRILQVKDNAKVEHDYDVIPTSIMPLLQVDHDIRKEVMKSYSAPFAFTSSSGRLTGDLKANWEIDVLFIQSMGTGVWEYDLDSNWEKLFGENIGEVKRDLRVLAGSNTIFWDAFVGYIWAAKQIDEMLPRFAAFRGFVKLEEVVTVIGPWTGEEENRLVGFEELGRRHAYYECYVE